MKTFWSQIENKGSLKVEEVSYDFWFKTLRDSKGRVTKDHGKKFRSRLASSQLKGFKGQILSEHFSWVKISIATSKMRNGNQA